jgi:branched-chain amino acid transport system permease protein
MPKPHVNLLLALAIAWLVSASSGRLDPYHLDVLIGVGINIILAVSLNLIAGHTGQFSLGHAGFMAVGAYAATAITLFLGPRLIGDSPAPGGFAENALFFGALLAAGAAAAIAGLLVGIPSLRLRGDYLALVTLGFGEIIRVLLQNFEPLGGALGLNGIPPYTTPFWVIAAAAATVFTVGCLVRSTYGLGFRAVRDDEIAASAAGLDPARYKVVAFTVGAFFAGIAGALFSHFKLTITPAGFDFTRSIEIVVMVILGGLGNTLGVILAAVLLTLLPEFLRPVAEYRLVLYAMLLIALMLLRPQGLFNFTLRRSAAPRV